MDDVHEKYFLRAINIATNGLCLRAKCGAVIISNESVIGEGYNAPPKDDMQHAKCENVMYDRAKKPKYDLTCCVHAEWRAMIAALRNHPDKIRGATIYYARLDEEGLFRHPGPPFCTVCSRLALDIGIKYFGLWHKDGVMLYDTSEYNERSYSFHLL